MDNVASEVNLKIKSAIKAKLVELKSYVDDELPDYIMVLVANKKTKDQMDDDLSLFLGHNTERFTTWLHFVLAKLNAASVLQKDKPSKEKSNDGEKNDKKSEDKINEDRKKLEKKQLDEEKQLEQKKQNEEKKLAEIKRLEQKKQLEEQKLEEKKAEERKRISIDYNTEISKEKRKKEKKKDKKHKSEKKKKNESKAEKKLRKQLKKEAKEKEKERKLLIDGDRLIVVGTASKKESSTPPPENLSITFNASSTKSSRNDAREAKVTKTSSNGSDVIEKPSVSHIIPDDTDENDDDEDLQDVLDVRAVEEDLGFLSEEEVIPKKKKKEKRQKNTEAVEKRKSETKVEGSSKRLRTEVEKVVVSKPTVKDRLHKPSAAQSEHVSVHSRIGVNASPKRNIINLREESSFPPKSELKVSNTLSSSLGLVSDDSSASLPSTSNRKLEARVRPLMVTKSGARDEEGPHKRIGSAVGAVLKRSYQESDSEEEEEYNSSKSSNGIASKVEVTPRPRRSVQPNSNLILRAMADAHKSTNKSTKRHKESSEEPVPIKKKKTELFTRGYRKREEAKSFRSDYMDDVGPRKIAITVPYDVRKDTSDPESEDLSRHIHSRSRKHLSRLLRDANDMESDTNVEIVETEEYIEDDDGMLLPEGQTEEQQTRFIVTLNNNDVTKRYADKESNIRPDLRSRLGTPPVRDPNMEEEECIEEVEEWEEVDDTMSTLSDVLHQPGGVQGKPKVKSTATVLPQPVIAGKLNERCRFWPACSQGEACLYIHPKVPCKTFPLCKFGDKCLYLHPTCKFDANCTKPVCPFMHTTPKTQAPIAKAVAMPAVKFAATPGVMKPKCKYFPQCTNMNCPFNHPTPCRYGISCGNKTSCRYSHPDLPSFAKLKWSAPKANETKWTAPKPSDTKWTSPNLVEAKKVEKPLAVITETTTIETEELTTQN